MFRLKPFNWGPNKAYSHAAFSTAGTLFLMQWW